MDKLASSAAEGMAAKLKADQEKARGETVRQTVERVLDQSNTSSPPPPIDQPKALSLTRDDAIFWIGLALFAAGVAILTSATMPLATLGGALVIASGIFAVAWATRGHMPKPPVGIATLVMLLLITCGVSGYDLYDRHFGRPTVPAVGRIWEPLSDDQKKSLELVLGVLPTKQSIQVICLNTDCKSLAESFMSVFNNAGWNPVMGTSTLFFQEPYGIVLYQTDTHDQRLKEAIEKATTLRVSRIAQSNLPNQDSIFLGLKP